MVNLEVYATAAAAIVSAAAILWGFLTVLVDRAAASDTAAPRAARWFGWTASFGLTTIVLSIVAVGAAVLEAPTIWLLGLLGLSCLFFVGFIGLMSFLQILVLDRVRN